jgi:HprK-related kinase B
MSNLKSSDLDSVAAELCADARLHDQALRLALGGCTLRLRSNSIRLIEKLKSYFAHVASPNEGDPDLDVIAIEREAPNLDVDFIDWKREPGKSGRKDAYRDIGGGRLVLKVRTGMLFLQSDTHRIAAGPCDHYDNQVINFINAQYMNWLQHRGWLICHAAGLVYHGAALGIAGFSGGGKSTLMLRQLDRAEVSYLTNDRLFIRTEDGVTHAAGIPKLPRVNPGTIVHNPKLHGLLSVEARKSLLALPTDELWHLEHKYDVYVEQLYGKDRIVSDAPLAAFLILNWRRDTAEKPVVEQVDLAKRRDLLGAIMKSPGPFYQYPDGSFYRDTTKLHEEAYLDALLGVRIYEARGGVDFDAATEFCMREFLN